MGRMCGRFTLDADAAAVQAAFDLPTAPPLAPRYNIAPTQPIAAVRPGARDDARELTHLHWGLIPSWSRDVKMGARMINARGETVHEKPSFRAAFKRRRCLIPATGFYEWQRVEGGKQPMLIRRADTTLFAFAGLWERWMGPDGSEIESGTIITTEPNTFMRPIHNRMPVILAPEDYAFWLAADAPLPAVRSLLRPCPAEWLEAFPVSRRVNSPHNEGPDLIVPLAA